MRHLVLWTFLAGMLGLRPATVRERLVYVVESDSGQHIGIARADGSEPALLTSGPLVHLFPAIDAPATQVAFVEGPDVRHLGVIVMNLKTLARERFAPPTGMNLRPRFSGDGRYLAFSAQVGNAAHRIAVLDLEKERKKGPHHTDPDGTRVYEPSPEYVPDSAPCFFPVLSSDGHWLVYHRQVGESRQIVYYELRHKVSRALTELGAYCTFPALSFDDRRVAYTRGRGIEIQDLKTGTRYALTDGSVVDHAPTFRPDGSLVFSSSRGGHYELYEVVASEVGKERPAVRPLIRGAEGYYGPCCSGPTEDFVHQELYPSLPQPPRSSFGAVLTHGRIYLAGGHKGKEHTYPPESFMANLESYDIARKSWVTLAPRPVPCHGFQLTAYKDRLYAFGGFAHSADHRPRWKSLDVVDRYDIKTDSWRAVARLPRPRSSNVVAVFGSKAYLIGGWDSTPRSSGDFEGRFLPEVDIFDMETETVSTAPYSIPKPLRRALSAVVVGDEVILVGGLGVGSTHFELLDKVTAFNPVTGKAREWTPLPFPTFAPAIARVGDELLMMGGMHKLKATDYEYLNHIFHLNSPEGRWVHTGRYLEETKGFSQVLDMGQGELAILGGHSYDTDEQDGPVSTFELLRWR
jgi:hypothetical protein